MKHACATVGLMILGGVTGAFAGDRVLRAEMTLSAPVEDVWKAWASEEGVKTFFAPGAHIEPRVDGPPAANTALTSVESELTVYAPGRRAWPTTKIWMERSCPRVTSSSKLRKFFATAFFTASVRSWYFSPATGMVPTRGMLTTPFRSTTAR